jgi:HEAT repeat protein
MATVVVGQLGTNALPAVPVLLDLLVAPDSALRKAASSSLRKIAPEFLTNGLSAP